ncbi:MAG: tetratricopeptide repeat protein [Gammaproteobacteria bacterium]|nr:tetratricopeptide repeat protein [Gammaproteobacteria bacterium]NIR84859.1 tetratricopeptide repeat protein [Gammaproteobacteria bacterium]NIR91684.1 tetratricopeptide repeat protein [Gammaproteobacteria bacterium]NIU05906.1 tetratricopeptide repeat protein [Gammaproteobacteria bacterium]NIV52953.1 tetratricopeptide repeat protein [Gammaproteobacteria bacterium]
MSRGSSRPWTVAISALALAACAVSVEKDIAPGASPPPESDEAGLWLVMDRVERELVTSGQLADDPRLQEYVREISCRVAPRYCEDARIYVVEQPGFNATMAPNGFMTVWTGLLLRCENEAQLATVLGHEIGHYQRRHTLEMWRSVRATSNAMMVFSVATAMAGVGYAGNLGQLVALGQLMAFSRDHEREADALGFEMMTAAGYAPGEASRIWEGLLEEKEASGADEPFIFFATHPPSEERFATLKRMAEKVASPGADLGRERFLEITGPQRGEWLEAELKRRRYARVQVLLDRLMQTGTGLGELHYYQGELLRRRGDEGDLEEALTVYRQALEYPDAPARTWRDLGFAYWSLERPTDAREAFERYLALAPAAGDSAMIRSYIERLR